MQLLLEVSDVNESSGSFPAQRALSLSSPPPPTPSSNRLAPLWWMERGWRFQGYSCPTPQPTSLHPLHFERKVWKLRGSKGRGARNSREGLGGRFRQRQEGQPCLPAPLENVSWPMISCPMPALCQLDETLNTHLLPLGNDRVLRYSEILTQKELWVLHFVSMYVESQLSFSWPHF